MDINFNEESLDIISKDKVIISKQQRNGRKSWTIIENFAETLESETKIKDFIKLVKKTKCCNGSLKDGSIIQFQGDWVDYIKELLVEKYDYQNSDIEIKGV